MIKIVTKDKKKGQTPKFLTKVLIDDFANSTTVWPSRILGKCNKYILFDGLAYTSYGYFASCVVFSEPRRGYDQWAMSYEQRAMSIKSPHLINM